MLFSKSNTIYNMKLTIFITFSLLLVFAACQPTKKTAEQTARHFLEALERKQYAKAKQFSTENTKQLLDLVQKLALFTPKKSKKMDVKKMACVTTGDNQATCNYCCNEQGENGKLDLVKVKGKWLVDMKKNNGLLPNSNGNRGNIPPPPPPPPPSDDESPYTPQEVDPSELVKHANTRDKQEDPVASMEKTAESFLQALDDQNYENAALYSGGGLNKIYTNLTIAKNAVSSENVAPPSKNTNYAIGCRADSVLGVQVCTCTNFKTKEKTTLRVQRDSPDEPWKVIELPGRSQIVAIDQTNKELVAANFLVALLNRNFAQAKALASLKSAAAIDFVARHSTKAKLDEWDVSYYDNLEKIRCQLTSDSTTASCPYCCNGEAKNDVVLLRKEGEKWLVEFKIP